MNTLFQAGTELYNPLNNNRYNEYQFMFRNLTSNITPLIC